MTTILESGIGPASVALLIWTRFREARARRRHSPHEDLAETMSVG